MTNNQTDFRALCAELYAALEAHSTTWDDEVLLDRVGTALRLAQPESEGPTDEPLGDLIDKWVQEAFRQKAYGCSHPTHTYVACKAFEHGRNHAARAYLAQPEPEGLSHETAARNAVESCLAQREEVLEAFIAKHGFCPDEAIQVEQRLEDGSTTWRIERRAALTQPEPEAPTDVELQELLYYEFTTSTGHGERSDPIAFARAVLARWGSQPSTIAHSGARWYDSTAPTGEP